MFSRYCDYIKGNFFCFTKKLIDNSTVLCYNKLVDFTTSGRPVSEMEERFKTFTVLIAKINRSIRKIKTEEMAEFNLKSPHVSCLYYLYKEKSLTAKELCDICDEDKAAVSRSILYLEREGYIVCNSDAPKRYKSLLCLTEKGLEIGKVIAQKIDGILSMTGDGMTEEEMAVFYKCLGIINNNLQNICNDYRDNKYLKNEL